jgi:hypothetical protein
MDWLMVYPPFPFFLGGGGWLLVLIFTLSIPIFIFSWVMGWLLLKHILKSLFGQDI